MFYSHNTNHSRAVLILISDKLQFESKTRQVGYWRSIRSIDASIQDSPFLLLNIYSPTKTPDQCAFFSRVLSTLDEADSVLSGQLIIGGDFNVHLEAEMDGIGGR